MNDLNSATHRRFDAGERTYRRRDRLGQGVKLDRHFGDDAQRAFGAHHQARQVVAGAALFGAGARAHNVAAGSHHRQGEDVFTHRAIAHCVGTAGSGRAHAAQGGVGTRVYWEEQAGALDRFIELFARDACLYGHSQVFGIDRQHPIHSTHVDTYAALHGKQVAF